MWCMQIRREDLQRDVELVAVNMKVIFNLEPATFACSLQNYSAYIIRTNETWLQENRSLEILKGNSAMVI